MKRILTAVILFFLCVSVSACTQTKISPTEPLPTEEERLSASCDRVLAQGKEENGDHYELAANGTADYSGVKNEIGVIKTISGSYRSVPKCLCWTTLN